MTDAVCPARRRFGLTEEIVTTGAVGELTVTVVDETRSSDEKIESLAWKYPAESMAVIATVFGPAPTNVVTGEDWYVAVIPSAAQDTNESGSMDEPQSWERSACAELMSEQPFRSMISAVTRAESTPLLTMEGLVNEAERTWGTTLMATDPVLVTGEIPVAPKVSVKSKVLYG